MKKILLALALIATAATATFAQSEKYTAAMQKNLTLMQESEGDPAKMLELSNNFERIAQTEKQQWQPYYYAALAQINYSFSSGDMSKADPLADKADELIAKADAISRDNSEITVLKAMSATLHMLVNPMQRYMKYGTIVQKYTQLAKDQDNTNPRPYMLEGQSLKSTPEQFGGGCKTAAPILKTAVDKYATFKPKDALSPNWGGNEAKTLLESCEK